MKLAKTRPTFLAALAAFFLSIISISAQAQSPPNIGINNYLVADKVAPGRSVQAVVEMHIPGGYHVNSNKPLEKFLIPTQLTIEKSGFRTGAVSYPRAILRNLKFSKNRVAVYEGKAVMRFTISVPPNFSGDGGEVKARLRYQSCSDEVCFPPQTREVKFWVRVGK